MMSVPRILPLLPALLALVLLSGCGTEHPGPIERGSLAEAQTFPYFKIYWVGPSFEGSRLAAADGLKSYNAGVGDSVYYGDCVKSKGIFGGGSCLLPLQVTTVVYSLHPNATLGPQSNALIRGVPATIYDQGRSIEIYTGQVAIDIFSDDYAHAFAASLELLPINAPGSATANLPPPVYCPGLSGPVEPRLEAVLEHLPHHICARTHAQMAYLESIS
jgi:hypothetical protein